MSENRCAHCGEQFNANNLVVDHLIPLSLLGADARENWVVMHRKRNLDKWDRFLREDVKLYRTELVSRFGIRFIDGVFWPVINGRVRYSRFSGASGPNAGMGLP
jgi:putative addiction module component (TIGR02574 family)